MIFEEALAWVIREDEGLSWTPIVTSVYQHVSEGETQIGDCTWDFDHSFLSVQYHSPVDPKVLTWNETLIDGEDFLSLMRRLLEAAQR